MQRRQLIMLLGAVAVAWPFSARAQRGSKSFRVGILANEKWPPLDGLRDGLRELGYIEGQNLELVHRYVEGQPDKYAAFTAELIGLPVDIIVTWGTPASLVQPTDDLSELDMNHSARATEARAENHLSLSRVTSTRSWCPC
jgi:hypothetical protein